jgi:hypothetical protein
MENKIYIRNKNDNDTVRIYPKSALNSGTIAMSITKANGEINRDFVWENKEGTWELPFILDEDVDVYVASILIDCRFYFWFQFLKSMVDTDEKKERFIIHDIKSIFKKFPWFNIYR